MKNDWPHLADLLAARVPRDALHPAALALAWAETRTRGAWAVAFSGGADSLALLLLLWAHFPERRGKLVALHFNHRLRGRAADADEAFCRRVCAALGVTLPGDPPPPDPRPARQQSTRAVYPPWHQLWRHPRRDVPPAPPSLVAIFARRQILPP